MEERRLCLIARMKNDFVYCPTIDLHGPSWRCADAEDRNSLWWCDSFQPCDYVTTREICVIFVNMGAF